MKLTKKALFALTGFALLGMSSLSQAAQKWTMTSTWPASIELVELDKKWVELANKLDWLTGGMDGIQGLVFSPLLGSFEFDLQGRVAAWYSLTILLVLFLVLPVGRPRRMCTRARGRGVPPTDEMKGSTMRVRIVTPARRRPA